MDERKHDIEIEIDAPADLVWRTISEADGITRWFAPEAGVEPGAGGKIRLSWGGGMEGNAPITVWEPGRHLQWMESHGQPRVIDVFLEAEGGRTRVRLVHSGFGADAKFDNEYDSTHGGWSMFLAMLRYGLEHHADKSATHLCQLGFTKIPQKELAERMLAAIGSPALAPSSPFRIAWSGGKELSGTVIAIPRSGYACLAVEQWNGSILALFAEHCAFTISAILFGAAADMAAEVRREIEEVSGRVLAA